MCEYVRACVRARRAKFNARAQKPSGRAVPSLQPAHVAFPASVRAELPRNMKRESSRIRPSRPRLAFPPTSHAANSGRALDGAFPPPRRSKQLAGP